METDKKLRELKDQMFTACTENIEYTTNKELLEKRMLIKQLCAKTNADYQMVMNSTIYDYLYDYMTGYGVSFEEDIAKHMEYTIGELYSYLQTYSIKITCEAPDIPSIMRVIEMPAQVPLRAVSYAVMASLDIPCGCSLSFVDSSLSGKENSPVITYEGSELDNSSFYSMLEGFEPGDKFQMRLQDPIENLFKPVLLTGEILTINNKDNIQTTEHFKISDFEGEAPWGENYKKEMSQELQGANKCVEMFNKAPAVAIAVFKLYDDRPDLYEKLMKGTITLPEALEEQYEKILLEAEQELDDKILDMLPPTPLGRLN